MSDVAGIHHTGYTVANLNRSLAFYQRLLGCEILAEQEKRGGYLAAIVGYPDAHVRMAHLRHPGSPHVIEFFEYVRPTPQAGSVEPRNLGNAHLCFVVGDLERTYRRLREAGVDSFISTPVDIDTGVNNGGRGLYLRDPDGIVVELFQPPSATQAI